MRPEILPQIEKTMHTWTLPPEDLNMRLISEIDDCLDYFSSFQKDGTKVTMVHGIRIAFGRLKPNKYFFERDVGFQQGLRTPYRERVSIKIGVDKIRVNKKRNSLAAGRAIPFRQSLMFKQEVEQIIESIHNVTAPYTGYVAGKGKDVK